ncbi:flagellar hook-associated protein FlgK [Frateuria aurantia]|uniref:Flagellar hook-associated protein 1 n=1 Tax=Frateuria aurantia (strain ATCC 33424 / DSM 6220 / KCTC 2777 / LMG 1558 / NBRC 3245 / NCIMB 13370) TaxID=767434 RepID=H8L3C8_FRAAD|nr:flagellar hook-associated protein FlgK [Frateuria aurantia]AFC86450.1 flagellar hook-associated protein FlgK [Frateuria aurantia DSM 6220]
MSNLLSIAISGLNAAKAGLAATSNNLANVDTTGYSRQSVQQSESSVVTRGDGYAMGSGVTVSGVTRASNPYLTAAVWSTNSASQSASTYNDLATTLNNALSGSGSLQTSLDSLFSGFTSVSSAVSDTSVRQTVLGDATAAATNYNTLASQFAAQQKSVNQQIGDTVTSINSLTSQIATLNTAITGGNGTTSSGGSNALLDQRDALVTQLAGYVGISAQTQSDGSISVYTQSGQALVAGSQANALGTAGNAYDATQTEVTDSNGSVISSQISGGSLGGLISYRDNVLSTSENMLGLSALGLASSVNSQQAAGLDLNGKQGAAIFSTAAPSVAASSANTGDATVSASISNTSALTTSNYILRRQDGAWSLSTTGGQSVSLTTNSDGTLSAAGMTFTVSGTAKDGDSYQIKPTADAASSLSVSMTDPAGIAAAAAVVATASSSNTGATTVKSLTVTDSSQNGLLDSASVKFTSATDYEVLDASNNVLSSGTYDASKGISANGWTLSLSGNPAAGDSFSVSANTKGLSDNTNALKLAALSDSKTLGNGSSSIIDSATQLTSYIGTIGSQASTNNTTQSALYTNAVAAQQSVSGVSEDEEASNLVKFQQAYQASAQAISTAQSIFSSLLSAIRS